MARQARAHPRQVTQSLASPGEAGVQHALRGPARLSALHSEAQVSMAVGAWGSVLLRPSLRGNLLCGHEKYSGHQSLQTCLTFQWGLVAVWGGHQSWAR